MNSTFLSRFTPSLMPPEVLEAVFVQREDLANLIIDRVRRTALGREAEHTLLTGPRGIGKTHLISLIYYRLKGMPEFGERLVIAWLREEEWGIASLLDVLLRICRALPPAPASVRLSERIEALYSVPAERAKSDAIRLIREVAGNRTLLIMAENLDDLFRGLGHEGQVELRQYLRDNSFCSVVATAQSQVGSVLQDGAPFRGFFQIHALEGLSFEDACQLLTKLALHIKDRDLAGFVGTPLGRARIRALRYLAGGNHRVYVVFSQFLTRESLEDVVGPLVRTIDDLTPYYQSRIAVLSPEQRKIIEWICECRHPVQAAEIRRCCFLSERDALAQLQSLCGAGYLDILEAGREKYYDLREPLLRLSIEVKKNRGEPLQLLVDFLRLWYSPTELKHRLDTLAPEAALERQHVLPALEPARKERMDPRIAGRCREYNSAVEKGDYARALLAAEELVVIRATPQDRFAEAYCLRKLGRYDDAVASCDRVIERDQNNAEAWHVRGSVLCKLEQYEAALEACEKALRLDPNLAAAWVTISEILTQLERNEDAVAACDKALRFGQENPDAWFNRGLALGYLERFEEAAESLSKAVQLDPDDISAHIYRGAALLELKRHHEALECGDTAIRLDAQAPQSWIVRGTALAGLARTREALECFDKAMDLGDESPYVQFKRAELRFALDRWREGAAILDEALRRFSGGKNPDCGDTVAMVRNLLNRAEGTESLGLSIRLLVLLYRKHKSLHALAHGLVESVSRLTESPAGESARSAWLDLWRAEAGREPEFNLALRLLSSAVRYLRKRDFLILMELPQEERLLLEPLLDARAIESA